MRGPHLRAGLLLAVAVLIADQATKQIALAWIDPTTRTPVLPFLNWVLVWNRGVSFGMFGAHGLPAWVFIGVSVAIGGVLMAWLWREQRRLTGLALGLVLGGAVGNVVDRIVHGAVVDFIDLHAAGYHWPAFNIADSAIVIGAAGLVLESLFAGRNAADTNEERGRP